MRKRLAITEVGSISRTALDLRQLMAGPSADIRELSLVDNQLARRLDWTARELIGEED